MKNCSSTCFGSGCEGEKRENEARGARLTATLCVTELPSNNVTTHSKVVPRERVRLCSEFMPTISNNPNAAYVDDQARIHKLDFTRMQVFDADDNLLSRTIRTC